jgi:hypothetical protein
MELMPIHECLDSMDWKKNHASVFSDPVNKSSATKDESNRIVIVADNNVT